MVLKEPVGTLTLQTLFVHTSHHMRRVCAYGILWLLMAVLIFPNRAEANRESRDSSMKAIEEPENDFFDYVLSPEAMSGDIPFTLAGNLIIIQAAVDSEKGNFILDTGAPGLVLNLTYFRYYRGSPRAESEGGGITGRVETAGPAMVKKLSFGGFEYKEINAHRINLGHIENSRGIKILGLLGSGLFSRFEMLIDYENEVIHLHRVAKSERMNYKSIYRNESAGYSIIPMQVLDGKLLMKAMIGKQKLNFVLDTGAEVSVLDSRLSGAVFETVEMERKITLTGTSAKKTEAWYGRVKQVNLGPVKLTDFEVLITSLKSMSDAFGRSIDGMLGYSFLSKQKIAINFVGNEIYIWK